MGLVRRCGDHRRCQSFNAYARCPRDDYEPTLDYHTQCAPAYPFRTGALATLMLDSFTLGKLMTDQIESSILYVRTSGVESFFHAMDIWIPMWASFSDWGYDIRLTAHL